MMISLIRWYSCLELLDEFKRENPSLFTEEVDDSGTQRPITIALSRSGLWDPTKLGGNLKILTNFLHSNRIRGELHTLQDSCGLGTIKAYNKPASTASILADWFRRNNEHNIMDSYLSVLPEKSLSAGPILLYQAVHAAQGISDILADTAKLHIIARLVQWQTARSLISVYLWHARYAPKLADQLVSVYHLHGFDHLKAISPSFAGLVDHIFRFVINEQENPKQSKARLKRQKINDEPPTIPDSSKSVNLEILPSELLGYVHGNQSSQISLRKSCYQKSFSGSWRGNTIHRHALVCKRTATLLQELWSLELIVPHLMGIDGRLNSGRRTASKPTQVRDRALARGAILHCMAQVCGTDSMFASLQAIDLISSPTLIYGERLKKDQDFARNVLKDETSALQPLVDWLILHMQEDPNLIPLCKELGRVVHLEAVGLQFGSLSSQQSKDFSNLQSTSSRRNRKKLFSPITRQQLLPNNQSPKFSLIGLILREAINERRELKPGNEILFRVLTGVHASRTSATTHNRDQTDPVRQYNRTALLLQTHLPGSKLTTRHGLSNLLAWMGTGQGNKTTPLLNFITTHGGFYSDSLECMVWKFEQVMDHNAALLAARSTGCRVGGRLIPGYIPLDDVQIWGQSCNLLSATPTVKGPAQKKMTLEDKFSPYFENSVQDSWIEFLGDLAGQNPNHYSGSRKTWKEGLDFVVKLHIKGFLQGLTPLQLVNNLVFLDILAMPEPVDIADWIYDNSNLGAYHGLGNLGFVLSDCGSVRCAFMCVYEHLNKYMMRENKELLGFNPIFVEHILCKVERWNTRLKNEVSPRTRLDTLAEPILQSGYVWSSSETGNEDAFPFPLEATLQELDQIINEATVSYSVL